MGDGQWRTGVTPPPRWPHIFKKIGLIFNHNRTVRIVFEYL